MLPLNLTLGPPRSPHAALDGIVFLPRSIDKTRAALPGGDLGAYQLEGLTTTMLEMLGIPPAAFTEAVAAADDDARVVAYVRERTSPTRCAQWNAFVRAREPRGGNRADALTAYPWLAGRPDLTLVLDVLEHDDALAFGAER